MEVGVVAYLEIDLCDGEQCGEQGVGVDGGFTAHESGQHGHESTDVDLHRKRDRRADRRHEFRTVERKRRERERECVTRLLDLHELGHLTRPVDDVGECEVDGQRAADLDSLQSGVLERTDQHIEDVFGVRDQFAVLEAYDLSEIQVKERRVVVEDILDCVVAVSVCKIPFGEYRTRIISALCGYVEEHSTVVTIHVAFGHADIELAFAHTRTGNAVIHKAVCRIDRDYTGCRLP